MRLQSVRERREEESKREWAVCEEEFVQPAADIDSLAQDTLKEEGFQNEAALEATIKKLEADLKKSRKKEADGENEEVRSAGTRSYLI